MKLHQWAKKMGINKCRTVKSDYIINYTRFNIDQRVQARFEIDGYKLWYVCGLYKLQMTVTGAGANWRGRNVQQDILKDDCHQDRLGSTADLTDQFGRVVGRADYNEWGLITYKDALDITSSCRRIWRYEINAYNYNAHNAATRFLSSIGSAQAIFSPSLSYA